MKVSQGKRFLLLEVINPHYHSREALVNMDEVSQLVTTYGGLVVEKAIQHRVHPHPSTHIGQGKLEWLKTEIKDKMIDVVVINAIIKPSVLFRIEKFLWVVNHRIVVWDRVDLILGIFDKHAGSKEAQLQIELARLAHTGPRIYGLGRTELSRQGGGIGQRGGFGETNIEFEKRQIKTKMQRIKKELKELTQKKQARVRHRKEMGFGPVAIVGYTSAGKTTLFNVLTGKKKRVNPSLFTTLDTVVGKMKISQSPLPILISDTIGFIANLPPNLIDAFKSTLIESLEATLLLHVIDVSDPECDKKISVVETILHDLHIHQPIIRVFNKIDRLSSTEKEQWHTAFNHHLTVGISATKQIGILELKKAIIDKFIPEAYG